MDGRERSELDTATAPSRTPRDLESHGLASLDKFESLRVLGQGGHSIVHEARHRGLDRLVAVKVSRYADPTAAKRMLVEAQLLARVSHPGIVEVYEFGETTAGAPFLVMERLVGRTLKAELQERGALPAREVLDIGIEILSALAAVHRAGLVHRDIKPSNVMRLEADRNGSRVLKLIDFGVGRDLRGEGERLTEPGELVGTPAYLAPEQLSPHLPSDERTDLYGVGVTLYELLTGRLPFEARGTQLLEQVLFSPPPRVGAADPGLPAVFDSFLRRALAKAPSDRFPDANRMRAALAELPLPLA